MSGRNCTLYFLVVSAIIARFAPLPSSSAQEIEPARPTPNLAAMKLRLGKALFHDQSLSRPEGMSCASCHSAATGFTSPRPHVNKTSGQMPGAVEGRFGNRVPPTVAYAALLPVGPPYFDADLGAFVGGLFWDGRANDLQAQAQAPFVNPNEMNNLLHNVATPQLVVEKVRSGASADLFRAVYGVGIFHHPTAEVYSDIAEAISVFEESEEVSPFSSKYDAYLLGKAALTDSEMRGLQLITGSTTGRPGGPANYKSAQCVLCHGIPTDPSTGPDIWTNSCFANIGVPKNPGNPYYKMTDSQKNPAGFNSEGANYIDLGLGGTFYPTIGLPPGNDGPGDDGQGDYLQINGTFKAPTLRNVDRRPDKAFVKAYMHNGFFKNLKDVVHFYNTRNLTSTAGEVIDFTQVDPYANLRGKPLWPAPEYPSPDTLQNPSGAVGSNTAQVGNLGLTDAEENDIVAFLEALSDGYNAKSK